jgi:hypothetical protein
MVCLRNIRIHVCINTLHKGDDDDDNDNNNNNDEGDVTVLWNQAVHTNTKVTANRPDTIINNKKQKTCTLIDVAIPADRNAVQKGRERS